MPARNNIILVTGATGTVGTEVVMQLVAAGHNARVLVRNLSKAEKIRGPSVAIVEGDMSKPETLRLALDGVERVFLLAWSLEHDSRTLAANVVDEAKRAGVQHIVKLSGTGVDLEPGYALGRSHRESEQKIEGSGIGWTHVRPGPFMSNLLFQVGSIKAQGAFYVPAGEGKQPVIDPRDIAAVAVKALTEPGHEGKVYTLTGPEALSYAEMASQLSTAVGRQVKYVDVPESAAREGMQAGGMPASLIDTMMEFYRLVKAGSIEPVSPEFERVVGRRPRTFAAWAREHAEAFK